MRNYRLLTFIVFSALILTACTSAAPAPTAESTLVPTPIEELTLTVEELVGYWKDVDGYLEFKPDGTFGYATTLDALRAGNLEAFGKFKVEGDEFTFVSDNFCGDKIGIYRLIMKTENKMTFTLVQEECTGQRRLPFLERIP